MKTLKIIPVAVLMLVTMISDIFQRNALTGQETFKKESLQEKAKNEMLQQQIQQEIFEGIMENNQL